MKNGGRLPYLLTILSVLAATALGGILVYATAFDALQRARQRLVDQSVAQGVNILDGYIRTQYNMLALYASVPMVQEGRFPDVPEWLTQPGSPRARPRHLSILDDEGRGLASTGGHFQAGDREYFRLAKAGTPNVSAPMVSRVDQQTTVVVAWPVPGHHPRAAVLTVGLDLDVFSGLLNSLRGSSGAELTLTEGSGATVVRVGQPVEPGPGVLVSTAHLTQAPWTLTSRVGADELTKPVQQVLLMVGLLVAVVVALIIVFFVMSRRHRRSLDEVNEDRTRALRDAYEQIRKLAYYDPVTRLPNRALTTRKIGEALQAGAPQWVAVVAISRFRSLSTTFGMKVGDSLLKEATQRLSRFAEDRGASFLGRLGGSEFLLLVPEASWQAGLGDELLGLFNAPMGHADLRLHIGVHVGACRMLEGGRSAEEVIKSVETALWAAREKGPGESSELTPEAVARRHRRAQLQKLLPGALDRGEVAIHYQPQVDSTSGRVHGYEALMRWTSPELGPVGPSEFIPVAEETGTILALGGWVLDQGIAFARELERRGTPAVVSVNVSPVQLLQLGFLEGVVGRAESQGLAPRWLGLEITETTLIENKEAVRPALERLMAAGVKVSLDDFGTGYSSLNYLKELPFHVLKVDKTFIDDVLSSPKALQLIQCIIDLAHHLGLRVLAEGIETEAQLTQLTKVGCDLIQGYYTGRPAPSVTFLTPDSP